MHCRTEPLSFAEDETRLFRIQSILKVEGTLVLRKCLDNQLGANALATVLNQPSTRIKIENALKRKVIKINQFALLYPAVGSVQVDTLDITLLTFLIRELHLTLKSNSQIWSNPNPNDLSVEADSTRLRNMRNHFAHEGRNQLSEKDFNDTFFELRELICRVSERSGFMESKAMSDCLDKKKIGPFDAKPALTDRSTSTDSSLERNIANFGEEISIEKPELHVNRTLANHYIVLNCTSNLKSLPHGSSNSSSSTCILKKKIPQVTTFEFELSTNQTPKQNLFCACFSARSRFREHSYVKTAHHSDLNSDRCQITGIDNEMHNLFIADFVHNSIQVFDANGSCTDEYECPQPSGVCMFSESVVVVSHRNDSFVELLKFDRVNGKVNFQERINIKYGLLHYEVKCDERCIFVLCENSSVHYFNMHNKNKIEDIRSIEINSKVRSFDCFQGFTYLSTKDTIFCLDPLRRMVWRYPARSDGPDMLSFEGLTITNKRLYVAQPLKDSILELSLSGKFVAEIVQDSLECPFRLTSAGSSLWVSQYSPYLNHEACRTIVQLKK